MGLLNVLLEKQLLKLKTIKINNLFGIYNYSININNKSLENIYSNEEIINTTIIYGVNGQGKTTIFTLVNAILNCEYETIDSISFDSCNLIFESEDKENDFELKVIKCYRDSLIKVGRFARYDAIFENGNDVLKVFDYIIDANKYEVYFAVDISRKKSRRKWIFYNDSGVKELFEKKGIQSSILIDSQRIYREANSEKSTNKFDQCVDILNDKLTQFRKKFIDKVKSYYKDKKILEGNNNLSIDEYEKQCNKMLKYVDKNGWLLFPEAIEARKNYEKYKNNNKLKYENNLKNIYNLCYMMINDNNFKEIEMFLNVLNKEFFVYSNKRFGICYGQLCLIYSKDDINFDDSFEKYYQDITTDFRKYQIKRYYSDLYDFSNQRNFVIPITKLSSGEKNLFALLYELIFNFKDNQIMFIDEPEISINIYLQEKLIDLFQNILLSPFHSILNTVIDRHFVINDIDLDTGEVLEFKRFKAVQIVIATHSPNICRGYENCMIELKESE